MVRAETGGRLYDVFRDQGIIAIGWVEIGELGDGDGRQDIAARVRNLWPEWKAQSVAMSAGQLFRFRQEMSIGDAVVTYDPSRRVYLVGEISGDYAWRPDLIEEDANTRAVTWRGEVSRDLLSVSTRNSLGAISTLFMIPPDAASDVVRAVETHEPATAQIDTADNDEAAVEDEVLLDIQERALEFTKDKIIALDWDQMQELVAGLLRAMGYRTRVSAHGSDLGKDIIASPDAFGFQDPRIFVEVKHRKGTMGAPEIRNFLGGRGDGDKGLYVSTGGFTKEARYEAERAKIPMELLAIDELVELLLEHYEQLDWETQQLVPLKKLYWPL